MAIWMLGKACMDDMSETDNLSNYASLLTMLGGEHLAIPILQNLVQKFPKNTTLLNNLGQAWFGLGELTEAEKYLDQAMHGYALHPQANLTQCKDLLSQGRNQEAIECTKRAIQENYTSQE
jgi:tetratricopeptide (TPR) repeat protein